MNDPHTWCMATFEVRDALNVLDSELTCHLSEDHAASEFPKWLHYDQDRELLWCEQSEMP
jgi:hypothetical protein